MRRFLSVPFLALALTACAAQQDAPLRTASAAPALAPAEPAPLSSLVAQVDIPYEQFTLPNGLTTLVHTDRKAPVVGVTVYYRVGSKHEPRGRTGFAHLFEHLFFGGSENVPSFDVPLENAGSTPTNGSTWYDRTNYVETVPTGALDLALFMESDRMGHLLGAVDQDKLDKQRGVVQNEKRQGDNEPYGLVEYAIGEGLFPVGHPYRHSTIGSMADLNAASLEDVRRWYVDHYGPNNVVLALTGDIDAATARPMVERWFGNIPRGPDVVQPVAKPVRLPAKPPREMTDQVPLIRLHRAWNGPGLNDPAAVPLAIGMSVLGGLAGSRLDNVLVRDEQLAVAVTASAQVFEQVSMIQVTVDVKPGVDRAVAEGRLDLLLTEYINEGPTEDELRRAATTYVASEIGALERVGGFGGKGATLAEGVLYSQDPEKYKRDLAAVAALTPADVTAAMMKYLRWPRYRLAVTPGPRTESGDTMGGRGDEDLPAPAAAATPTKAALVAIKRGPKREAPPVAPVTDLAFPAVERTTLSNGVPVALVRRTSVPKVLVHLDFDAGFAADTRDTLGAQSLMMALLEEGTKTRDSAAIAAEQERLGASINAGAGLDASTITLDALSANLAPSLALMADIARNPAFAPAEVSRLKDQRLAQIGQEMASPYGLASRALAPLIYGDAHPYGVPASGLGQVESVQRLDAPALRATHDRWLRPDLARITVVGDVTMAELTPLLEASFDGWKAPSAPRLAKDLAGAIPAPRSRIVVIDRPNSPQSVIYGGRVLPLTGRDADQEALELANEVLGDGFLSRLNLNLREEKGWSYGVRSTVSKPVGPRALTVAAPVQSDRTGDALKALIADMRALPGSRGVEPGELARVTEGNIRGLPNRFETNAQVLSALVQNQRLGRADDYYGTLASRWRAIDAAGLNAAAGRHLQPEQLVFVVVGDRKVIEPQLGNVGLPVEYVAAVDSGVSNGG